MHNPLELSNVTINRTWDTKYDATFYNHIILSEKHFSSQYQFHDDWRPTQQHIWNCYKPGGIVIKVQRKIHILFFTFLLVIFCSVNCKRVPDRPFALKTAGILIHGQAHRHKHSHRKYPSSRWALYCLTFNCWVNVWFDSIFWCMGFVVFAPGD